MNDREREARKEERDTLKKYNLFQICAYLEQSEKIYWDKNYSKCVNAKVIKMLFCPVSVQRETVQSSFQKIILNE